MKNKELISIYKRALQFFFTPAGNNLDTGICHALSVAMDNSVITDRTEYNEKNRNTFIKVSEKISETGLFKDFYAYKCKCKMLFGYWWPINEEGREQRIQVLEEIITKLEKDEYRKTRP